MNGAKFISTNPDLLIPGTCGKQIHTGAFTFILEKLTNQTPVVLGKPTAYAARIAMERLKIEDPSKIFVIGDSFEYDALFALSNGMNPVIVTTGIYQGDLDTKGIRIIDSLTELL